MKDSDARDGATIRANRATPTAPDASATAAAKAAIVIAIGDGTTPTGIAAATAGAATRQARSGGANDLNAPPSAVVTATVPSGRLSIALTATAPPPTRLVTTPRGGAALHLLRKAARSGPRVVGVAAVGAVVDVVVVAVVHAKAPDHTARPR